MKKIEQIRDNYDLITEKDDSDTRKLTSLVRAGLFDQKKLPMLKRALEKDPSKMTMAERKALLELLDSLMSQVLHSQSVYSKVKQNVGSDMNEAVKDRYGVDPRFGSSAAVSERDMPTIIILKRKSIRVYPDNQKVGLYYSQYLDRYIAIPFGTSKKDMPFTAINEEVDEAVDYNAAYKDYKADNPDDDTKDKILNKPNKLRKFVAKKAAQGKIRSIHYSTRPNWLGGDKEKNALKKVANKEFNKSSSVMDYVAGHTGVAIGNAIRKGIRAVIGKKSTTQASAPNVQKTKEVSAPTKAPTTSSGQTHGERAYTKLKAMNLGAPTTPKVTSTSGKATASFGGSMTSPITAKVSAPKMTAPKIAKVSTPKPSREQKRIAKLPGMGDQPKTGDFPQADKKVKTFSTNTQLTQARALTPLEKKTGTVNPEKQLPRKRYAGIDPKVPGTGPQPTIGKLKPPGKRMLAKLEEKRHIEEQGVLQAYPLATKALGAMTAGVSGYLASKSKTGKVEVPEVPSPVDVSIKALARTVGAAKKIKDTFSTTASAPVTKKKVNPGSVMAKAAKDEFDTSQKTSASDFAKLDHVDKPAKAEPVKTEPSKIAIAEPETKPQQVKGADVPKADAGVKTTPQADTSGIATAAATGAAVGTATKAVDSTWAKSLAKAKENAAEKKDKDKKDRPGKGRPRPFKIPSAGDSSDDERKFFTPVTSDFKAKLNKPQGSTKTGVDTRMSNLYRKSFETPMKEETDEEEKKARIDARRFFKPATAKNNKLKVNEPKPAGVTTGVDARMRKYERDMYSQQNESVLSQIKTMIKEDVTEMQLNIGENTLKINNTIAKKVVGVYESLNTENKKKMENMLNEGSTDSFMKLINFAVRY